MSDSSYEKRVDDKAIPSKEGEVPVVGEVYEVTDHGADSQLKRQLGSRHISMIGLASSIGMGLWLGSGTSLMNAGPAGIFLGYLLAGTIIWSVSHSIGEMAIMYPLPSAVSSQSPRLYTVSFAARPPANTTVLVRPMDQHLRRSICRIRSGLGLLAFILDHNRQRTTRCRNGPRVLDRRSPNSCLDYNLLARYCGHQRRCREMVCRDRGSGRNNQVRFHLRRHYLWYRSLSWWRTQGRKPASSRRNHGLPILERDTLHQRVQGLSLRDADLYLCLVWL